MIAAFALLFAKSAVFAGTALALTVAMRRRPAAERVEVLRAALIALALLPVIAVAGPDLALRVLEPASATQAILPATPLQTALALPHATVTAQITPPPAWVWIAAAWSLGAMIVAGRFALGIALLARWTRRGRDVSDVRWTAPLQRLSPHRQPSLRVSTAVPAPLSWGLSPGRILIAPAQLARPDQAEAVLAHELAHIRRADWPFLALSRLVTALFWFNPLVWIVGREMERLSEQAVDEAVVRHVDRETYARILVGMAAQSSSPRLPAAGMTGPARSLTQRIKLVMSDRRPAPTRPWIAAAAVAALAAVAAPVAAVELSARAQNREAPAPAALATAETVTAAAMADTAGLTSAADGDRQVRRAVITNEGRTTRYVINDADDAYVVLADGSRRPMTAQERREVDEARTEALEAARHARQAAIEARAHARVQIEHARTAAVEARAIGERARTAALAHARDAERRRVVDRTVLLEQAAQARAAAVEARAAAARHRVEAVRIREQVAREMAAARTQMAFSADSMQRSAHDMREEARRLGDPAYRARKIEEQRQSGYTVTDQQLLDAIPKMMNGADRMEQGAARMRTSARSPD